MDLIFEPLGTSHDRAAFSCGVDALDKYLQQQARQAARSHVAVPFVVRADNSSRIIGYYTLSAFTIEATELPAEVIERLPRYEQLPAVLIGRLAVDRDFAGQGIGSLLLIDALHRSLEQSRHMGRWRWSLTQRTIKLGRSTSITISSGSSTTNTACT